MWISIVYLLLLSCSITLGKEYFDCRRQGQDCANNKICQNDGTCDCGNDYTGYNCELQKNLSGSSPCTNQSDSCGSDGGICYNNYGSKACFCPPGFHGDHCENKRYEVTCEKSSMLIVINPAGTFSGVVYAKDQKDTTGCMFTISELPSGKQGVALNVKDIECGGVSQVNGDRTRDVIIQFSEKYMTNLDTKVSVTCSEKNNDAITVTVTKVITTKQTERDTLNITNADNSIDSSLVQFNINLKDGSSVSGAVSLHEELTFEFITNLTGTVQESVVYIVPATVRLVGGNTTKGGRLEVLHEGEWRSLNSDSFSMRQATVVCRNLGFTNAYGLARGKGFFPEGSGDLWTGDFLCKGFEIDVNDCRRWKVSPCDNTCTGDNITVICEDNSAPYEVRLVDGNSKEEGTLEISEDGQWYSVCKTGYFSHNEANVVCRQMGYSIGTLRRNSTVVSDRKWKYEVICDGWEPGFRLCFLKLRDEGDECLSVHLLCSGSTLGYELRLVGGPTSNYGVVEIKQKNQWGKVYDKEVNAGDAKVMCRTLGYNESYAAILLSEYEHNLTSSNNQVWTRNVECPRFEKNITLCRINFIFNADDEKYIALLCAEDNSEIKIRLVNGSSEREGRVEIKYLGMWGTVCDKYHTDYNAAVYCRMLGFTNSNATAVGSAYFGEGSGPIFLRDIHCLGNETSLEQCNLQWGNSDCKHNNDAGVICRESEPESGAVTVEPGTLRVESCTADNEKTGEDSETLKIIEDSCPSSEIGKLMTQEPERSGNNVTFKLKAFTFNKNNKVSIECSVKVCPPDQKSLCDPVDCNGRPGFGRKRRSTETSDEIVRQTYTVVEVMNENKKPSDSQTSGDKQGSDEVDVSTTILIILCVVMVIIFSLVIWIVVVVFLRKKKSNQ